MNAQEILATLKKLGKPQTAAIYKRYGTGDNVYGTLTSDIVKLTKKVKVDHALAMELWDSGNVEARAMALLIADPNKLTAADAERFLKEATGRFLSFYLADLLARSPMAHGLMRAWMKSSGETSREMGYSILAARLKEDPDSVSTADAATALSTIEKEIARSPNWARYAMNNALIAIGVYKPTLRQKAIAAAKRIGVVDVDHGETYCKTPNAAAYIAKAAKRR